VRWVVFLIIVVEEEEIEWCFGWKDLVLVVVEDMYLWIVSEKTCVGSCMFVVDFDGDE